MTLHELTDTHCEPALAGPADDGSWLALSAWALDLHLGEPTRYRGGKVESGPRDKDAADLARVLPSLDGEARKWLAGALRTVHTEHQWLEALDSP